MELTFGMACDGPSYPDFPGAGEGVFAAAILGPMGLLETLEIQLGLTGRRVAQTARVACYAAKLRAALEEEPELFFAQSVALDPWATSASLLAWRDELVAAGWERTTLGADRVDALARVERSGPGLAPGMADRLRTVCGALTEAPSLWLVSLQLVEQRAIISPPWRGLIDALEAAGVEIVEAPAPNAVGDNDLGRVRRFLANGAVEPLQGDGSIAVVRSDTTLVGAEALAEWLAHGTEEELHGTVVVSTDGDTALLDLALQARGLPALGRSAASPWRGALQVLRLAFAAAWAPFDARAMLDLLVLPRPPLSRRVARKLANALSREPGTGGHEWASAWAEVEFELQAQVAAGDLTREGADKRLASWREWTTGGLHSRTDGMTAAAAKAIAARVGQWAFEADAGVEDPLLLSAAGASSALVEAIDLLGIDLLPALLVERMIDQVLAEGAPNPDHFATAGGLRCVCHPAAIWGEAARVVWWDFKGPGDRVPVSPWTRVEIEALEAAGCRFETPAECARRIELGYVNAVWRAGERLLLVAPFLSAGEETTSHPLAHRLEPILAPVQRRVTWTAERLLEEAEHQMLGRAILREQIALVESPRQRAAWPLPAGAREKLAGRVESATSFERLSDCQMRWMLLDVLRLSRGRAAEIPGPDQLLGNLAHELANAVFRPGPPPDPATVLAKVEEAFDAMLGAIATPLQQPQHAGELAAARTRVPQALAQLAALLRRLNLEVVGTELDRSRDFADGLAVAGRIDLVIRHPEHGLGVIDLKWTKSARRRRTELAEGRALQLATYGEIADPTGTSADGAYYLLNQRRLIGLDGSFLADEVVESDRTLGQTWIDLVATWRSWRDLARDGMLVATGTLAAEDHVPADLAIAPGTEPCKYCELTGLCRVAEEAI